MGLGARVTVQIKGVQIAGLPAIKVRDMLGRVHHVLDAPFVAERCRVSKRRAKKIIEMLVSDGYLEFAERSRELAAPYAPRTEKPRYRFVDCYKLRQKGERLSQGSAAGKMPRTNAERIIERLLGRVAQVNAASDYLFNVATVIVYGSYVRGEALLSDVDIAVELEPKWDVAIITNAEYRSLTDKRVEAARANGRVFPSFLEQLDWPRREVILHLRAQTRGLSLHELADFAGMVKDENFAYVVLQGNANRIAEMLASRDGQ
jgi:predicted nucleotidyltransferase